MLEVVRRLLQPLQSALQARGGLGQGELRTERVEIGAAPVEAARAAAQRPFFQASIVGHTAAQAVTAPAVDHDKADRGCVGADQLHVRGTYLAEHRAKFNSDEICYGEELSGPCLTRWLPI